MEANLTIINPQALKTTPRVCAMNSRERIVATFTCLWAAKGLKCMKKTAKSYKSSMECISELVLASGEKSGLAG